MSDKDPFSADERSEVMSAVGSEDTEPELMLRKRLWHDGLRYRIHDEVAGTKPDIVFRGPKVAVFVDGCFWHGCPEHYTAPEGNADFWREKLDQNQARDERDNRKLREAGWTVVRVWECDIREDVAKVAERLAQKVRDP